MGQRILFILELGVALTGAFFGTLWLLGRTGDQPAGPYVELIESYLFASGLPDISKLGSGWSGPEGWGVWSVGKRAEIRLPWEGDGRRDIRLTLRGRVFLGPSHEEQRVAVEVNGARLGQWQYRRGAGTEHHIRVPHGLLEGRKRLDIVLNIANPRSPKELGLSPDPRRLGIGLKEIDVDAIY